MSSQLETSNLIFRKLKISDYQKFRKLFFLCFKKKVSYNFFKWRYFSDDSSFCYGVFDSSDLIANVGMKSMQLNNKKNERVFSRHSSMVLNKYRGKGIFSKLLNEVKISFLKDIKMIIMWPNKNNFATFGINKNKILKQKYYLYETSKPKVKKKITLNHNINQLKKYKNLNLNNDSFFFKNFEYFKKRYLSYKKNEYSINIFQLKNFISFFILKKNKHKFGFNYVILDHFGSKNIQRNHLLQLINEKKIIFWSKKKIHKQDYNLITHINLNIGFIKNNNVQKKNKLLDKKFMLGDTDSFITIN